MPETPEELFARAADELRAPTVEDWDTWPFEGPVVPRRLQPPLTREPPRHGAGGVDCRACANADSDYLWTDENWRIRSLREPTGLPLILLLEPRAHHREPGDLPDAVARELGLMLVKVERAVRSIAGVGRVHLCRWGDGAEHLHWWFIARPERLPQLTGSFAAIWDDVLPPLPEQIWRENIAGFLAAFGAGPNAPE